MNTIDFSFIIPMYQAENTIINSIRSIIDNIEEHISYEIIVVDDGSSDNGSSIVENLDNFHITVLKQKNSGVAVARNKAIKRAKGKFILFLDADDNFNDNLSDALDKALSLDLDITFIGYEIYDVNNNFYMPCYERDSIVLRNAPSQIFNIKDYPYIAFCIAFPWNKIYKREFILKNEILFPDFRLQEDVEFHFLSIFYASEIGILNDVVITHTVGDSSCATAVFDEKRAICINAIRSCHEKILKFNCTLQYVWIAFVIELLYFYYKNCSGFTKQLFYNELLKFLNMINFKNILFIFKIYKNCNMLRFSSQINKIFFSKISFFKGLYIKFILIR